MLYTSKEVTSFIDWSNKYTKVQGKEGILYLFPDRYKLKNTEEMLQYWTEKIKK